MAAAWVRSLSCNSSAVADDVLYRPPAPSNNKTKQLLLAVSCAAANDVKVKPSAASAPFPAKERPRQRKTKPRRRRLKPPSADDEAPAPARPAFLAMTELPGGHSSRRVVELIFASRWGADRPAAEVEALFRVHSSPRAVARFEGARAAARARGAAASHPRCAADGNEMMRFQCRAAEADGDVICAAVATCSVGESTAAVRTFAGSGAAHAGAGEGPGRRAMLVCRVIAGCVRTPSVSASDATDGYESLDMGGGELVVLDSRAVLPCFLIIYNVKTTLQHSTTYDCNLH